MKTKTILLGLNELNFDYLKFYISQGVLPNFKKIFEIQPPIETVSENEYKLLEPWVQWVTIHSGKSYKEHNIFRLGDIVNNPNFLRYLRNWKLKVYQLVQFLPLMLRIV